LTLNSSHYLNDFAPKPCASNATSAVFCRRRSTRGVLISMLSEDFSLPGGCKVSGAISAYAAGLRGAARPWVYWRIWRPPYIVNSAAIPDLALVSSEFGPCHCKQHPGLINGAGCPLGLAAAVVGLRGCRRPRRTGCTTSNPALIGGTSASVRCQSRRSSTLARDGCHRRPTNARLQSSSPRSTICRMVTLIFL
jgi:hypothetical protein